MRSRLRLWAATGLLCCVLGLGALAGPACVDRGLPSGDDPADWAGAQAQLARLGGGFLVWESNRSGAWRIWTRRLDGSGLRMLSPDEPDRDHFSAHISPDGTRVAYLSYPRPWNSYHEPPRADAAARLVLWDARTDRHAVLARAARSYGESRAVVWVDAWRLIYLDHAGDTRLLDLATGSDERIARNGPGGPFLLNPTLSHATSNSPSFSLYRDQEQDLVMRPLRDGCQPYFTRDGRYGYWTTRAGGPVQRLHLASERMSTILTRDDERLPEDFGYVYFPMVSPGQQLLAFGASDGDHDHFRADYEIFLAPIDPRSLEITGAPVRYSFDPGTDRFPDVFVAGTELGHHEGEAPFPVDLDPSRMRLDFPQGAVVEWDFGDGTTSRGAIGRHVYEHPGRYIATARIETAEGVLASTATVDVDEPKPPAPLRSYQRDDELLVEFDEPIDAEVVELRFDSGAGVRAVGVGPDGHTLHIRTDQRLPVGEVLEITGVRDRGAVQRVMPTRRLDIEIATWPMDAEGLVLAFDGAGGPRWRDAGSDAFVPFTFQGHGRARLDRSGALVLGGGAFHAPDAVSDAIAAACSESSFTVEALLRPLTQRQPEASRVLTLEEDGRVYLALAQYGARLRLRVRTDSDKILGVGVFEDAERTHFVASYADGRLTTYRNGLKVQDSDQLTGALDWGEAGELWIGQGAKGHTWKGRIEKLALYCRHMGEAEVANNARAALGAFDAAQAVPAATVRAELVERSEVPPLEAIAPYREGLFVAEWKVLEVLSGESAPSRVRVAHYAYLNGERQGVARARVGSHQILEIEPFDAQPQAGALYLSDTLPFDADVPLYLDVRP